MKCNERKNDPNYQKKVVVFEEDGPIDYDPEGLKGIVGGEKLTYDEYLKIQKRSAKRVKSTFQACYYNFVLGFKGQIERRSKDKICFKRIFVEGMYPDGECFDGKEDHVWMDAKGFESFGEGDSVAFIAEVYRYIKTGKGKSLDYGLRNPEGIKRIDPYELPSDDDLIRQEIGQLVCDTCYLQEQCNRTICYLPKHEKKRKVDGLFRLLKKMNSENSEEVNSND